MNLTDKLIILASASPRRKELMKQAGYTFTVIPCKKDEIITASAPCDIVKELSFQKAENVFNHFEEYTGLPAKSRNNSIIIGSDTIVSLNDSIMGKPKDKESAFHMINKLQGNTHQVYTGVTLLYVNNGSFMHKTFFECTNVTLYSMSEDEISSYIASGEPMDKAGAYGIQGRFAIYIKGIQGDYNNVVGLPIARLYQELKQL